MHEETLRIERIFINGAISLDIDAHKFSLISQY